VTNLSCTTETNNKLLFIGPNSGTVTESVIAITDNLVITDLNVSLNIEHTYNEDLEVKLIGPDGTTEVVLFEAIGGSGDNFTNTVLDDTADSPITSGSAPFTGTFSPQGSLSDFNGLMSSGLWTLSITDTADSDGGQILDWSLQICYDATLSLVKNNLDGIFKVLNKGSNQYEVNLTSNILFEDLNLNVYNLLGQKLLWKTLKNDAGVYSYNLDMSYASSGIYLIRLGNIKNSVTKRIIVE
jgi:subtilisin-like proprotein convertase family protein